MTKKIDALEAKLAADKEAVAAAKAPAPADNRLNELKDEQARTEMALNAARMDRDATRGRSTVDSFASEVATNKRALEIAMDAEREAMKTSTRVGDLQANLKASEDALAAAKRKVLTDELGSSAVSAAAWAPNTSYPARACASDPQTGGSWECLVAHTSGSGTMSQDRAAHTEWWKDAYRDA